MKNMLNEMIIWKACSTPFNLVLSKGNIMQGTDKNFKFSSNDIKKCFKKGEIIYKIDKQWGTTV